MTTQDPTPDKMAEFKPLAYDYKPKDIRAFDLTQAQTYDAQDEIKAALSSEHAWNFSPDYVAHLKRMKKRLERYATKKGWGATRNAESTRQWRREKYRAKWGCYPEDDPWQPGQPMVPAAELDSTVHSLPPAETGPTMGKSTALTNALPKEMEIDQQWGPMDPVSRTEQPRALPLAQADWMPQGYGPSPALAAHRAWWTEQAIREYTGAWDGQQLWTPSDLVWEMLEILLADSKAQNAILKDIRVYSPDDPGPIPIWPDQEQIPLDTGDDTADSTRAASYHI